MRTLTSLFTASLLLLAATVAVAPPAAAVPPDVEFATFVGNEDAERIHDVAVATDGTSYVAGERTTPAPGGGHHTSGFVRKYSPTGSFLWERTIGSGGYVTAEAVAVGTDGSVFVGGVTQTSNIPGTSAGWQQARASSQDGYVVKYDASGNVQWGTYLGGEDSEIVEDIAVASGNTLVIVGTTWSCQFPVYGFSPAQPEPGLGDACDEGFGIDAFVTKLTASGASAVFSTYLGGDGFDWGRGVAVTRGDSVLVAGATESADFPASSGAFRTTPAGGLDGYVAKLNDVGSEIVWATYLGGSGEDFLQDVATDASGAAYVTGRTYSADYAVTSGAFQTAAGGGMACETGGGPRDAPDPAPCSDAVVTKVAADGGSLAWSTYLGTDGIEEGLDIAVDGHGTAYVTGETAATGGHEFPDIESRHPGGGYRDGFAVAVTANGRALAYSLLLGGADGDFGEGVAVRTDGSAWYGGWTWSEDFPLRNADDSSFSGWEDGYLTRYTAPWSGLLFAPRGGNEFWVELFLGGRDAGDVVKVEAKDNNTDWTTLERSEWGFWAGSLHVEPGNFVTYRATLSDGVIVTGCPYTHPNGEERCFAEYEVFFTRASGNEWWLQVYASSGRPIARVDASIDGGEWKPLTKRSWGAWANSYHAPEGAIVQFRATSSDGATDLSGCYRWTSATSVACTTQPDPDPDPPAAFAFTHGGGNQWWVEAKISPKPAEVQARDTDGEWRTLTFRDWGEWAGSFRIEAGHDVQFRAREAGGAWAESCWFAHPSGVQRACDGGGDGGREEEPPAGDFDAAFTNVRGNAWWDESNVAATGGTLAGVDARVNGGAWTALAKTDWGSWAKSMKAPEGSTVEFRARSADGQVDTSAAYAWPPG